MMFRWFESKLNPYPEATPASAPASMWAFCWHYSRDAAPWLLLMSLLTAMISVGEVHSNSILAVYWHGPQPNNGEANSNSARFFYSRSRLIHLPLAATIIRHRRLVFVAPET